MDEKKEYKYISKSDALARLQKYCAYQERSHHEVRMKLIEIGCYGLDLENVICDLIEENFLNEQRFASTYAGGKFRLKKWGRIKIRYELKSKRVSPYCLKKAMEEISDEDYEETMHTLLTKKARTVRAKNQFEKRGKLARHLSQKGYESFLIWEILKAEEW
ncbi:MAG: regulatory protein [Saprospiraceae bacterium]